MGGFGGQVGGGEGIAEGAVDVEAWGGCPAGFLVLR